jgi:hypothetical protein
MNFQPCWPHSATRKRMYKPVYAGIRPHYLWEQDVSYRSWAKVSRK